MHVQVYRIISEMNVETSRLLTEPILTFKVLWLTSTKLDLPAHHVMATVAKIQKTLRGYVEAFRCIFNVCTFECEQLCLFL